MNITNKNYFERVYLGKKNDRVSPLENKRLQKLISRKASSAKNDLTAFRPEKNKTSQIQFELLLEKW